MIYDIPLQPVPAQQFTCTLSGRHCTFWLRQLSTGLHIDMLVNGQPVLMGAACLHDLDLIRNPASALPGRLYFTDTQGSSDPDHTGLGSRFLLSYDDGAA